MDGSPQGPQRAQPDTQPINLARNLHGDPQEGMVAQRTRSRLMSRLAMFVVAIILGAVAVAQAQKGLLNRDGTAEADQLAEQPDAAQPYAQPIPLAEPAYQAAEEESAYGGAYTAVDPGFDTEPVSYEQTEAYRAAMNDAPPPAAPPAAVQAAYGAEPSAYGDPSSAYGDEPAYQAGPPAPLTQAEPAYAYDDASAYAAPPAESDYGAPPPPLYGDETQAEAPPMTAQPAQFTQPAAPAATPSQYANSNDSADSPPMNFADDGDSSYGYDAPQGAQPQAGQTDQMGGAASISIVDTRSRQLHAEPTRPNPSLAQPAPSIQDMNNLSDSYADSPNAFGDDGSSVGHGKPGPSALEGTQSPSLAVSKSAPPEVQVGKPATFTITINNVGNVAAHDVLIRDEVPHGTKLADTSPPARRASDGALLWEMGTLEAGRQVSVTMDVVPLQEGEIGSVATVSFQTSASARSLSTQPELVLEHMSDQQVMVGEDVVFRIQLSNTGTGAATSVTLEEDVPDGLRHYDGRELQFQIGTLQPQESRVLELKLKADQPGVVTNVLIARADGDIMVTDQQQLEVIAPGLQVAIEGPSRRYLERRATHEIAIANPGTAPATNVSLVARLPRALKFINTNNAGQYDSRAHAVRWNLDELPANEMGRVELTTVPTEMGEHKIQVTTSADMGLEDSAEHEMFVDGLAALLFTVTDVSDPIEVGGETTYEVHVVNQGSKSATNLRLMAVIPSGMEAINGEGPTRVVMDGGRIAFDPLARLAPQSDAFFKIHVKGTAPGDQRVKVLLTSEEIRDPVTKEESTHVYSDQ